VSGTFVDTNVLLRHLTGEPPDQARRATRLLAHAAPGSLRLPDLIVAEMVYVLESHYRVERTALAGILRAVLGSPALTVADRPLLIRRSNTTSSTAWDSPTPTSSPAPRASGTGPW